MSESCSVKEAFLSNLRGISRTEIGVSTEEVKSYDKDFARNFIITRNRIAYMADRALAGMSPYNLKKERSSAADSLTIFENRYGEIAPEVTTRFHRVLGVQSEVINQLTAGITSMHKSHMLYALLQSASFRRLLVVELFKFVDSSWHYSKEYMPSFRYERTFNLEVSVVPVTKGINGVATKVPQIIVTAPLMLERSINRFVVYKDVVLDYTYNNEIAAELLEIEVTEWNSFMEEIVSAFPILNSHITPVILRN